MSSKSFATSEPSESSSTSSVWRDERERDKGSSTAAQLPSESNSLRGRGRLPWFEPSLLLLLVGELATRGASFIAFATLARTLRPEAFGKVECALASLMFGQLVVELGYKAIGARGVATEPQRANEWVGRIVPTQLMIALACFLVAFVGGALTMRDPVQRTLTTGYLATLVGGPLFLNWLFQGRRQMAWVTLPQVVRQMLFCGAAVTMVGSPADVWRLPLCEGLAVGVAAWLCLGKYLRDGGRLPTRRDWQIDRPLLKESALIGGTQLLWALRNFSPVILLSYLANEREVGLLGAVLRLVMTMQALVMIYWTNEYPRLCILAAESFPRFQRRVSQSCGQLTLALLGVAALCFVLAHLILQIVYGAQFAEPASVTAFLWAVGIVPITAWRSHAAYALIVVRQQKWELWAAGCGLLLLPILAYVWSPIHGAAGMAAAMFVSEIVGGLLGWGAWFVVRHQMLNQVNRNATI